VPEGVADTAERNILIFKGNIKTKLGLEIKLSKPAVTFDKTIIYDETG
jgi:hypothetical protein